MEGFELERTGEEIDEDCRWLKDERKKERGKQDGRRSAREEYAGGPNPPAARSYRSYKNFSRNNLQRLENRLIDCPTHDFACKQALRFFLEERIEARSYDV